MWSNFNRSVICMKKLFAGSCGKTILIENNNFANWYQAKYLYVDNLIIQLVTL